jgi:hypothetical protein
MQEILSFVEQKKQDFSKLPLFDFMQDKTIPPRQRLSFAPCMAHFILSFSDLNKYVLRVKKPLNRIQEIVNQYTYEDDNHWPWFITDIELLGLNQQSTFTQALTSIWSEETKITRQIAYRVAGYSLEVEPIIKLAVIESLEGTADIFFSQSRKIISEIKAVTKQEFLFFGDLHLHEEIGHAMATPDVENFLTEIKITDTQREQALYAVNKVFEIFTEWTYELLAYAHNHPVESETQMLLCV